MRKPSITAYRRGCQIVIVLLFILIPILNKSRYSFLYGNLLSFQLWFVPLADPLAILQLTIKNVSITLSNFIGALLPLLAAYMLGTVFCSWLCPYGFFSEMVYSVSKKLIKKKNFEKRKKIIGIRIKFILFFGGLLFFLLFSTTPILNQLSLPAWYTRFFQYLFGQGYFSLSIVVILVILLMEGIIQKRLWCLYVCPQSVLLIFAKRMNRKRLMVHFNPNKCICREPRDVCSSACSLSLQPKIVGRKDELECTNCGDCIVACKSRGGAMKFGFTPEKVKEMVKK